MILDFLVSYNLQKYIGLIIKYNNGREWHDTIGVLWCN